MAKMNTDKPDLSALWPLLPPWIEWVAMDSDYSWWGYADEPYRVEIYRFGIWGSVGQKLKLNEDGLLRPAWRKSLTRRPKEVGSKRKMIKDTE